MNEKRKRNIINTPFYIKEVEENIIQKGGGVLDN